MDVGEIKSREGLPDKRSVVYEHFARLKANFLTVYGLFLQNFPSLGGGGGCSPLAPYLLRQWHQLYPNRQIDQDFNGCKGSSECGSEEDVICNYGLKKHSSKY